MPRPRSDIRPRIVAAASECFQRDGVEGTALREVARAAGTSIGMIYYYFPTKDDLFFEVVEEVYVGLLQDLERALGTGAPVEDGLRQLYYRIAALSPAELAVVRLVVREAISSSQRFERLVERFMRGHVPLVLSFVSAAHQAGALRSEVHPIIAAASMLVLGSIPQVMLGVLRRSLPVPGAHEVADQLLSVAMRGLLAEPRAQRGAPQ